MDSIATFLPFVDFILTRLFQELTGYSENNDQYFETAESAESLMRFQTHYNAKYVPLTGHVTQLPRPFKG